jgi:hypothetical protein
MYLIRQAMAGQPVEKALAETLANPNLARVPQWLYDLLSAARGRRQLPMRPVTSSDQPATETVSTTTAATDKGQEAHEVGSIVFSRDYRSCRWGNVNFEFTPMQAAVVQALAEARKQGTPAMAQDTLLELAGSAMDGKQARLRDLFKGNPAWRKMIVPGDRKGTFKIADPPV